MDRRPMLRVLGPAMLLAGVLLFGIALFALGMEAAGEEPQPLSPSSLTTANGTAILEYPLGRYGVGSARVEVAYAFPLAAGDAYVLDCEDLAAWDRAGPPPGALLSFVEQRDGAFVVSSQTILARTAPDLVSDRSSSSLGCRTLVFAWEASAQDSGANRPSATVVLRQTAFDAGREWVLLVLMPAGVVLALAGGLAWARTGRKLPDLPGLEEGPLGTLRVSLDRMGDQLQSARRHLFYAGVLGVFLWYPVLVPWAWTRASRTTDHALFPWAIGALTLSFLLVLTLVWARELHRLDKELLAWRGRMSELRAREASLLDTFEQGR